MSTGKQTSAKGWRAVAISPILAFYGLMALLPMANLLYLTVHSVQWRDGKADWQYVGMAHFARIPADPFFGIGAANTVWFAVVSVLLQMVLGFGLALLVTRIRFGANLYKTLFILPILIPGIVVGAIWKLMYDPDFGVVNKILGFIGMAGHDWTGSTELAMASVIVVDIWHWTPFVFLLMLAGLESLPQDVYEAAKVDGTSAWRELVYITLPLMAPTIVVTLLFRTILAFKVFDEIFLLTGGGPGTATEVISFSIYRRFFGEANYGYAAALSVVTICVISLLVIVMLAVQRKAEAKPA
ncbi:MAG: sugar ABC transporter permease [Burkholderiaceae bacterium]